MRVLISAAAHNPVAANLLMVVIIVVGVLSLNGMFGLVALSGVLVNDSRALVDFINRARSRGTPLFEAVLAAGRQRFHAIVLTSVTTVAGLSPILFEKSVQAQFLIPMAISMSFGLMGATVLALILVPALYLLLYDVLGIWRWLRTGSFGEDALAPALVDTPPELMARSNPGRFMTRREPRAGLYGVYTLSNWGRSAASGRIWPNSLRQRPWLRSGST